MLLLFCFNEKITFFGIFSEILSELFERVDKDEFDDVYSSMEIDTIPGASGSIGDVDAIIHLKK